jgi:hypothetical protein
LQVYFRNTVYNQYITVIVINYILSYGWQCQLLIFLTYCIYIFIVLTVCTCTLVTWLLGSIEAQSWQVLYLVQFGQGIYVCIYVCIYIIYQCSTIVAAVRDWCVINFIIPIDQIHWYRTLTSWYISSIHTVSLQNLQHKSQYITSRSQYISHL